MDNTIPSAPISDYESFYDIETEHQDTNIINQINSQNQIQNNNRQNDNQYICNKIILNRLIFVFFICSISFIIYDHHQIINYYFNKLAVLCNN